MTATHLYDTLAHDPANSGEAPGGRARLCNLAERMIQDSLSDLDRIKGYEKQFGSPDVFSETALEVFKSIYELYQRWAREADDVLRRAGELTADGKELPGVRTLNDAHGRVSARLGITPEKWARSVEQMKRGEIIPMESVRDELRTRVHG